MGAIGGRGIFVVHGECHALNQIYKLLMKNSARDFGGGGQL
jgi:hypothetical protein